MTVSPAISLAPYRSCSGPLGPRRPPRSLEKVPRGLLPSGSKRVEQKKSKRVETELKAPIFPPSQPFFEPFSTPGLRGPKNRFGPLQKSFGPKSFPLMCEGSDRPIIPHTHTHTVATMGLFRVFFDSALLAQQLPTMPECGFSWLRFGSFSLTMKHFCLQLCLGACAYN